ncbi:MAG: hypothetical protein COC22_02235 [Flavobacteriaceae bacterium]|nr:MAG: hypothetical protein COC22_02235 [Flavobacteriaceae bacterium]
MSKIKLHISQFISIVLIVIVLQPFAIQFSHAFKKHKYSVSNNQNVVYLHHHKIDCSIFHYQLNYNTLNFSTSFILASATVIVEKIYTSEDQNSSIKLHHKSSRAPPILFL